MSLPTETLNIQELSIKEYAELVNGKVEGLRLALALYISYISSEEDIRKYILALDAAINTIESTATSRVSPPQTTGHINGHLEILNDMKNSIETLHSLRPHEVSDDQ